MLTNNIKLTIFKDIQLRTLIRGLGAHHSTYDTNRNYRPRYLVRRSTDFTSGATSGVTSGSSPPVLCTIYRYENIDNEKMAVKYRGMCDSMGKCVYIFYNPKGPLIRGCEDIIDAIHSV